MWCSEWDARRHASSVGIPPGVSRKQLRVLHDLLDSPNITLLKTRLLFRTMATNETAQKMSETDNIYASIIIFVVIFQEYLFKVFRFSCHSPAAFLTFLLRLLCWRIRFWRMHSEPYVSVTPLQTSGFFSFSFRGWHPQLLCETSQKESVLHF